jgi:HD-GYP domain-containing protein (c-di-GMP phosphodiesterase class II)
MTNAPHELKISIRGLGVGMFVSRLDRPWIGTPFPLEGLEITREDEVAKLQAICNHVFIDTSRGRRPDSRYVEQEESELLSDVRGRQEVAELRKTQWAVQADFQAELEQAGQAHSLLEQAIAEVMDDLRLGNHLELPKLKHGVDAMIASILRNPSAFVWLKEIKRRDNYSYQHALGCAIWAASFGRHLGLERHELQELALGGLLCDVGKTRLPPELLVKQAALEPAEIELVKQHVEHGLEIVANTPGATPRLIEIVASHHERHDGSGYPRGLRGSDIPIYARIMGLVDSYDAMTCIRPYASSRSPHNAISELYGHRGRLFQAELVEQFIQACGIYPTGTLVELSSGEVGVVMAVHSLKRLRPSIMLLLDSAKTPLPQYRTLDLSLVEYDDHGRPLTIRCGLPAGAYGIDPQEMFLD